MRRVLLVISLLLLAGCGGIVQPNRPNCNSAFAKTLPECQGQSGGGATSIPAATAGPTEIPVTPTPAAIKSAEYENLMTRFGVYGIQMEGFNPSPVSPYNETPEPFSASVDVVNLTVNAFSQIEGLQLFIVILKMDDSDYETKFNSAYNCLKADVAKFENSEKKLNDDGTEAVGQDGKPIWIVKDLFYPGSIDQWVYLCGQPGNFIHGYNGWAKFLTLDPSYTGEIIVRTCNSVNECKEATPQPVQATQTAPTATTAP